MTGHLGHGAQYIQVINIAAPKLLIHHLHALFFKDIVRVCRKNTGLGYYTCQE
jgi:hypothetical protein